MFEELVPSILDKYQQNYSVIHASQSGYRNISFPISLDSGHMANFILYKSEPGMKARIRRVNHVSNFLSSQNLPVRHTLDPRIMCLRSAQKIFYGSLYNYLPGQTISWEAYTKDHLKLTGMTMSRMHAVLASTALVENKAADEYLVILARMKRYFSEVPVEQALLQKLKLKITPKNFDAFKLALRLTYALPGQRPLHMDFVRGNLLFAPSQPDDQFSVGKVTLTGIIDFEKTAFGNPVFDVARTLSFLLVDCKYKPERKIRKYFLTSGYNKRGPAPFKNVHITYKNQKIDLLETLINLFLFYDFYKFLRHNPYESLEQNHHFVRTRDILIKRNMVKYSK